MQDIGNAFKIKSLSGLPRPGLEPVSPALAGRRMKVFLMIQRRNGPVSKIPHQASSRAKTQAHSTFVTCVSHCPSPQCSCSQLHGNSSGLLETHAEGLWVVTSSQENEVIYIPNTWF